jgi:hypothetical protein
MEAAHSNRESGPKAGLFVRDCGLVTRWFVSRKSTDSTPNLSDYLSTRMMLSLLLPAGRSEHSPGPATTIFGTK